jgi:hypothetical protein
MCPHFNVAYRRNKLSGFGLTVDDVRKKATFPDKSIWNESLASFYEQAPIL